MAYINLLLIPFATFSSIIFSPILVSAQNFNTVGNEINDSINVIGGVVNTAVTLLFAVAVLWLLWLLFRRMTTDGGDKDLNTQIIVALVVLFVMFSFWSLIRIFGSAVGVDPDNQSNIRAPVGSPYDNPAGIRGIEGVEPSGSLYSPSNPDIRGIEGVEPSGSLYSPSNPPTGR